MVAVGGVLGAHAARAYLEPNASVAFKLSCASTVPRSLNISRLKINNSYTVLVMIYALRHENLSKNVPGPEHNFGTTYPRQKTSFLSLCLSLWYSIVPCRPGGTFFAIPSFPTVREHR